MIKSFFKTFDKMKFILVGKLIFILAAFVLIVNISSGTYTRYESSADISANADIAFFVVDQGTYENHISINGLTPSSDPKYYRFYVTNYKDNKRANVDLTYTVQFETTTNLPLQYEIIRNESYNGNYTSIINSSTVRQDDNDVYYNVLTSNASRTFLHSRNELDEYVLRVIFPVSYKDNPDLYQGTIEMFSIIITATQVA